MRSAAHIAGFVYSSRACAGGRLLCGSAAPPPLRETWQVRCTLKLVTPCFQGALAPIASTGRQENGNSACRASTECDAAQMRNAVCQPDTHSEAAGVSKANDQAEVCGHACLKTANTQKRPGGSPGCCILLCCTALILPGAYVSSAFPV